MDFNRLQMDEFENDGVGIAFLDTGPRDGFPVLLIHGFASTAHVNWVHTGWVRGLSEAGYRVVALDNRGHGASEKLHNPAFYSPELMASDSRALLDHLGLGRAHVMGYSMGARLSAFLALQAPDAVRSLVFGGLGAGMIDGVGDWAPVARALLAPSLEDVSDETGKAFRAFADQTKSDRIALAACIEASRTLVQPDQLQQLTMPTLVAVGSKDVIAGSADELASKMPHARAFEIAGKDHMLAVGDKTYKAEVISFYSKAGA
ncbi:alpha/beta fold hydrolase [Hoeflea prorocentri]|uniref:Alpha/beta hydrolase n=1 Tax=Hoeflea prorocentri TaxID=1922333 RepID=A0A9X3UH68_9HYPH|nr:alpha/beta hydrolase [Hoeflea prorocentri]MCY6380390.1 alpha/beta hydrolase [Hoeflea prorocentri]MDA5398190.1 alpha/beta hydrolase [Hoeflea prorocentri]